jgi:hypothetical protein
MLHNMGSSSLKKQATEPMRLSCRHKLGKVSATCHHPTAVGDWQRKGRILDMKRFIAAFVFVVLLGASPCSAQTTAQAALPGLHKSVLDRNDAVPNTATAASATATGLPGAPLARDPIFVYNNWSAYDELSDNIPLTEQLAMKELDEILRLRRFGIRFDYYTIDAFWFDPDGGYRTWRKPNWPDGPDAWIRKCRENGILPGLWFSTNTLVKINAIPQWQDSLNEKKGAMAFFEGSFAGGCFF